jgi:V8-like Glu-specific endopeptidase
MRHSSKALIAGVVALAVAAPAFAITGGSLDGTSHPAVGLLLADLGNGPEPDCSGSLVSPTVFVTAAHCTGNLGTGNLASSRVWVSFDSQYVAGSSPLLSGTAHSDPQWGLVKDDSHDLAVVVLDSPVAGITPFALPKAGALEAADTASQTFTNVGYGYADRSFAFDGYRRWSASSLTNVKPTEVRLADKPGGVCFGDSGGPRLLGNVVVAVTSTGNKTCTGQSISYRLDTPAARSFLLSFVPVPY